MWAKAMRAAVWVALAASVWSCGNMEPLHWGLGGPTTRPASEGMTATGQASADEKAELTEAVELISQLRYKEAGEKLRNLLPRLAASGDVPVLAEATFWLGYCHEKQQQTDEAARYYRKIVNDYKDTPAARRAEERLNNIGGKIV